jgi:hypothetical protein
MNVHWPIAATSYVNRAEMIAMDGLWINHRHRESGRNHDWTPIRIFGGDNLEINSHKCFCYPVSLMRGDWIPRAFPEFKHSLAGPVVFVVFALGSSARAELGRKRRTSAVQLRVHVQGRLVGPPFQQH